MSYNQVQLPVYNPVYIQNPQVSNNIPNIQSALNSQNNIPSYIKIEIVKDVNSRLEWSSSICDCCIEPSTCLTGTFCPCVLFGKNVENLTNKSCCINACCCCIIPCSVFIRTPYRRLIRNKWQLETDTCNDCCVSFWCPLCSLCQESREIKYRTNKQYNSHPNQQFMV